MIKATMLKMIMDNIRNNDYVFGERNDIQKNDVNDNRSGRGYKNHKPDKQNRNCINDIGLEGRINL